MTFAAFNIILFAVYPHILIALTKRRLDVICIALGIFLVYYVALSCEYGMFWGLISVFCRYTKFFSMLVGTFTRLAFQFKIKHTRLALLIRPVYISPTYIESCTKSLIQFQMNVVWHSFFV